LPEAFLARALLNRGEVLAEVREYAFREDRAFTIRVFLAAFLRSLAAFAPALLGFRAVFISFAVPFLRREASLNYFAKKARKFMLSLW
jgi:hypothetical protein